VLCCDGGSGVAASCLAGNLNKLIHLRINLSVNENFNDTLFLCYLAFYGPCLCVYVMPNVKIIYVIIGGARHMH
jgi:hypothetical protein